VISRAAVFSFISSGVSVICGILIFFLSRHFFANDSRLIDFYAQNQTAQTVSYAILSVDESQDDRIIQEILKQDGIEHAISESTQYVFMDDFGTLKTIPLESYSDVIEDYDPRNDGYASKLSSFFVHDGRRFFFIPIDKGKNEERFGALQKRMGENFEGIPFQLTFFAREEPGAWYFLFLSAAVIASLFLLHFPKGNMSGKRLFLFQLPLLLAIGWAGKSAILLAAILAGIWELLREPVKELFASDFTKRKSYTGTGLKGASGRLIPYRLNLLLAFGLTALLPLLSISGLFPFFLLLCVFLCFLAVIALSFKSETERSRRLSHIPFSPVLLLPVRTRTFFLFPFLLPFGLVSVLAFFLFPALPGRNLSSSMEDPGLFVSSDDYLRHLDFQLTFSYRPLGSNGDKARSLPGGELNQDRYLRYYLGEDGLIAGYESNDNLGVTESAKPNPSSNQSKGLPSFPLEKLMDFLIEYQGQADKPGTGKVPPSLTRNLLIENFIIGDWIPVAIILAICALDLLRPGIAQRKKYPVSGDKRVAA
jgi:hypothetical protein